MAISKTAGSRTAQMGKESRLPSSSPQVKKLLFMITLFCWANLLAAVVTFGFFVMKHHDISFMGTGVLSLGTFWLLRMKANYLSKTENLIDISLTTTCGIYLPAFVLCASVANLFVG